MAAIPHDLNLQLEHLEEQAWLILEASSAIGRGAAADLIFNTLKSSRIPHPFSGTTGIGGLGPQAEKLVAAGLMKKRSGYYRCAPLVEEIAARRAMAREHFEPLRKSLASIGYVGSMDWDPPLRLLADAREAFFKGDLPGLLAIRQAYREDAKREFSRDILAILAGDPFDPDLMDRLPASLRLEASHALLQDELLHRMDHSDFRTWLMAQTTNRSVLQAQVMILEGRLEEAAVILKQADPQRIPVLVPMLKGMALLLGGQALDAPPCFEEAMAALRKLTKKRTPILPDLGECFWCLSLFGRRSPGDLRTLDERLSRLEKLGERDPRAAIAFQLRRAMIPVFGMEKGRITPYIHSEALAHPLAMFIACLAQHWAGQQPRSTDLRDLTSAFRSGPYGAFLREVKAMSTGGEAPLANLVKPVPAWERALEALTAMGGQPQSTKAAPSERPLRMAWRVIWTAIRPEIEALEQRRDAKGNWLKGKKVSAKRLFEAAATLEYLSPQDKAVVACVQRDSYWNEFQFQMTKALQALVGHPAVYWTEDYNEPGRPVEVLRGQIKLRLKEDRGTLDLALEPDFGEKTLIVQNEGLTRVRIYVVEDAHRRIRSVVGAGIRFPAAARERIMQSLGAVAPLVSVHSDLGLDERAAEDAGLESVEGDPSPHLVLLPSNEGLKVQLVVRPLKDGPQLRMGHGGGSLVLEHGGKRVLVRRDLERERELRDEIVDACPSLGEMDGEDLWILPDPEDCLSMLLELEPLRERVQMHWPKGQPFQTPLRGDLSAFSMRLKARGDWFQAEGELRLDEQRVVDLQQILALLGQGPSRFVDLGNGQFLSLTQAFRKRMLDLQHFAAGADKLGLRIHPLAALALEDVGDGMAEFKTDTNWREHLGRIRKAMASNPVVPPTFQAELRAYQFEGFQWMTRLAQAGLGACLADDMGLGKTVQALAVLVNRAERGPSLVVAPTSVCANWALETAKFAPTLRILRYGEGDREAMLNELGAYDLVIATYGLLQLDQARFGTIEWNTVVLDEAQAIKNAFTKRSQAAMALKADFRLVSTGTPIENHLMELWNLFRFLNPGLLGSQESFRSRYQNPIERDRDGDAMHHLKRLVRPFLLRRTKTEVLEELPSRTEITLEIERNPDETAFYEALRRESLSALEGGEAKQQAFQVLAALMRLRRACCHPELVQPGLGIPGSKLETFLELVEELRENRHRALVFSQFVDHLELVRKRLDAAQISYQYLDGSTPTKARETAVAAFQRGEGDLFLISLKAGGTGLNLTAADYVIHLDPWWNPAVEDQASDRAHRIGQTRPVTIYRLVAKGSIEQKIVELHQHKRNLADSLLEGSSTANLDADTLMGLLRET